MKFTNKQTREVVEAYRWRPDFPEDMPNWLMNDHHIAVSIDTNRDLRIALIGHGIRTTVHPGEWIIHQDGRPLTIMPHAYFEGEYERFLGHNRREMFFMGTMNKIWSHWPPEEIAPRYFDIIAGDCGWHPLTVGETMEVRDGSGHYKVTRLQ